MKLLTLVALLLLTSCTGLHTENDIFGLGKNDDKYYTHGTKFLRVSEEDGVKTSYAIGQNIYTPSRKQPTADPAILAKDRPYAGYLYGEYRETKQETSDVQNTWGVQLGCIGSCSLAKETQQGFHKLIEQSIPTWDTDYALHSEPAAMLQLEQKRKQLSTNITEYVEGDGSIFGLAKLGNVVDSASLGAEIRLGYNLPEFNSSNEIVFRLPQKPESKWSGYLFGKAEQRYVPYNHLLQGSLWQKENHTVDTSDFVSEGQIGFTIGYGKVNFSYTYVVLSDEWTSQDGGFSFGGLDFNW